MRGSQHHAGGLWELTDEVEDEQREEHSLTTYMLFLF
jgi:hypothetical protein